MIRDTLRCLFSHHNDVLVASLEFLEKVLSSPLTVLEVDSFYPQQSSSLQTELDGQNIDLPTSLFSLQFL